jgi:hypothetical protein
MVRPHMGTIAAPWRYDAAARHALQSANVRRPAILRYATRAAVSQARDFGTAIARQYSVVQAPFRLLFAGLTNMQWTKVQKRFEELVAPSLRGRVRVHVTAYGETRGLDVGRGRITVDREEVVSVQIPSSYTKHMNFSLDTLDFGRAVGSYVDLSVSAARSSPDPLLRGLAFLDKRLGKRSLASVDKNQLHEFEKALWVVRCRAEGVNW